MATDAERRRVAENLRGLEVCQLDGEFVDCGEVEGALGLVGDGAWYTAASVARLADLVEPGEPKTRCVAEVKVDGERLEQLVHDAAVELTGIDRDALLEIAAELDHPIRQAVWNQSPGARREHVMREYARRIREALGATEDE